MELYKFIKPLGILTFSLLLLTATSGLLKWKLKLHKAIAMCAVGLAGIHGLIVLLSS